MDSITVIQMSMSRPDASATLKKYQLTVTLASFKMYRKMKWIFFRNFPKEETHMDASLPATAVQILGVGSSW